MAARKIYKAKESFVTMLDGEQVSVARGDLAEEGAAILKGRDELFVPAGDFIRFPSKGVEQATAAPGEKRA